jgi:L-fuconolactonase
MAQAREPERGISGEQWLALSDAAGVERGVAVQRGRIYGYDNRYVCDTANAHPQRLQCVCQVDAGDPHCARQAHELISIHGAAGIRFMEPVKGDSLAWLEGDGARQVWRVASELGVPVSVHFFPWNRRAGLEALVALLAEFSPRAVVLDSLGGIPVEAGPPDYGIDQPLRQVTDFSGTFLKFTAMTLVRLAAANRPAPPLIARLAALFDATRLLWGSDLLPSGQSYAQAIDLVLAATQPLAATERTQALYGTAAALYPSR